jgi:hypothetical protein
VVGGGKSMMSRIHGVLTELEEKVLSRKATNEESDETETVTVGT